MQVIPYIYKETKAEKSTVLALGFFDGMHRGHRTLLADARAEAQRLGAAFAVFTFAVDDSGLKPGVPRLYREEQRRFLFAEAGVETVYMAHFPALSSLSAEHFATQCLCTDLGAVGTVCGFNYRFGAGAAGDAALLEQIMKSRGLFHKTIPPLYLGRTLLSSTAIRDRLAVADTEGAARMLGAPYFIFGQVNHGDGRGSSLGYPTVNLPSDPFSLLPAGVYATRTAVGGRRFPSVTNLGVCPTFGQRRRHTETYIMHFDEEIYGQTVQIDFLSYLREEQAFSSAEELKMQIYIDKNKALEVYKAWQEHGPN